MASEKQITTLKRLAAVVGTEYDWESVAALDYAGIDAMFAELKDKLAKHNAAKTAGIKKPAQQQQIAATPNPTAAATLNNRELLTALEAVVAEVKARLGASTPEVRK